VLFQGALTLVVPITLLIAFSAARQRILEEPGRHLPVPRRIAVVGLAVGWSFGLVHTIDHVGPGLLPQQVFWSSRPPSRRAGCSAGSATSPGSG
jgi:hypothetical protein